MRFVLCHDIVASSPPSSLATSQSNAKPNIEDPSQKLLLLVPETRSENASEVKPTPVGVARADGLSASARADGHVTDSY